MLKNEKAGMYDQMYDRTKDDYRAMITRLCKKHKMKETDFAFNGKGACPVCGGKGIVVSEMAFMDNIETTCEACGGLRYNKEVLQHKVNDKNIAQVLISACVSPRQACRAS